MNLEIELCTRCNLACIYCEQGNNPENLDIKDLPLSRVKSILSEGRQRKMTHLLLQGGEPTIHRDFLGILGEAKSQGFRHITLFTNGQMLADKRFTEEMLSNGVDKIVLSFQGPDKELHDAITRAPGSFGRALKGLHNLLACGIDPRQITNSTVMLKHNVGFLARIPEVLGKEGINNYHFINFIPYDNVYRNQDCMVKMSTIIKAIRPMLKENQGNISVEGLPFCLMKEHWRFMAERHELRITTNRINDITSKKIEQRLKGRIKPDSCDPCNRYKGCRGIHQNYYKEFGGEEFRPIL